MLPAWSESHAQCPVAFAEKFGAMNVYTVLPGLLGVADDADVDADPWPADVPPPPPFLPGAGLGDGAVPTPVVDGAIAEPKVPDPLAFACEHATRKVTTTAPMA